ncbi:MAG: hypothetical protein ACRYGF_04510, partial [Janthinobacterium lividum]
MSEECYPITILPHLSRLFCDYTELRSAPADAPVRRFYAGNPFENAWKQGTSPSLQPERQALVDALAIQSRDFNAGSATFSNLDKLRS